MRFACVQVTDAEERMLKKQLKRVNDDYRAAKRQVCAHLPCAVIRPLVCSWIWNEEIDTALEPKGRFLLVAVFWGSQMHVVTR